MEKEMATYSSVLAWRIPGMAEPGGLLSMGSHRVGHDWSDLAGGTSGKESTCQCRRFAFSPWVRKISWRRAWWPATVFLPGESHGQRSLAGYSPWRHKELDMTEQLSMHAQRMRWYCLQWPFCPQAHHLFIQLMTSHLIIYALLM